MKKPGTSGPGLRSCQRLLGFSVLPEQLDRYRGDLKGPDTTTRARTAGSNGHGIQILPAARGDYQTYDAGFRREVRAGPHPGGPYPPEGGASAAVGGADPSGRRV